jgi:hypothetical protein
MIESMRDSLVWHTRALVAVQHDHLVRNVAAQNRPRLEDLRPQVMAGERRCLVALAVGNHGGTHGSPAARVLLKRKRSECIANRGETAGTT